MIRHLYEMFFMPGSNEKMSCGYRMLNHNVMACRSQNDYGVHTCTSLCRNIFKIFYKLNVCSYFELGMFESDSILEKIDSFVRRIGILNRFFAIRFFLEPILNGQNRKRNGPAKAFPIFLET